MVSYYNYTTASWEDFPYLIDYDKKEEFVSDDYAFAGYYRASGSQKYEGYYEIIDIDAGVLVVHGPLTLARGVWRAYLGQLQTEFYERIKGYTVASLSLSPAKLQELSNGLQAVADREMQLRWAVLTG